MAYFDTSVITKWYLPEPDSKQALRLRARFEPPAVLTHLHRVELVTAWQLKVFRKELPQPMVDQAMTDLATDVADAVWIMPDYELSDVFLRAQALGRKHAGRLGVRTLDILHVAAALALRSRDFVTTDVRQRRLADVAGLRVVALSQP